MKYRHRIQVTILVEDERPDHLDDFFDERMEQHLNKALKDGYTEAWVKSLRWEESTEV